MSDRNQPNDAGLVVGVGSIPDAGNHGLVVDDVLEALDGAAALVEQRGFVVSTNQKWNAALVDELPATPTGSSFALQCSQTGIQAKRFTFGLQQVLNSSTSQFSTVIHSSSDDQRSFRITASGCWAAGR